ncbi:uncharacterized protein LOC117282681 isoform X2 [Cryptotermes secundus]|uniref:uncharacterized protein LOC117282681 isoform X2 n=1 Tax=Cryptotermes secundus TaxID=105785 RepID=UPI001454B860|nr:uncharacterized protein LOC117282681 isoform X2 [Cryptotermes secundus]
MGKESAPRRSIGSCPRETVNPRTLHRKICNTVQIESRSAEPEDVMELFLNLEEILDVGLLPAASAVEAEEVPASSSISSKGSIPEETGDDSK